MKKIVSLFIILFAVFCFSSCSGAGGDDAAPGKTEGAKVHYKTSATYTEEEQSAAAEAVREKFADLNGCVLYSLTFAGDERCQKELETLNGPNWGGNYEACIVFESSFRSPKNGGGAWEANEIYTWNWTVAREAGGDWTVVNYGYA